MRCVLAFLMMVAPLQALALSCMPYGALDAAREAKEAKENYTVVYGSLDFDEDLLPKVNWDNQQDTPELTRIRAKVSGHRLTAQGYDAPFIGEVSYELRCFGPWCPSGKANLPTLMFLKQGDGDLVLETDPCGGFVFFEPEPEQLKSVYRCAKSNRACRAG